MLLGRVFSPQLIGSTRGGGGGGGTLLFSYIRKLESCFWVQNFEFQYFFSENRIFWGYEDFVDIFGGHHKIRLYLGVISMHFRVFLWSRYRMGVVFGLVKFQMFLGCLKFLIFSWGER